MPKNLPEKEPSGTYKNSKLFPKNQQKMEQSKLLIIPESIISVPELSDLRRPTFPYR